MAKPVAFGRNARGMHALFAGPAMLTLVPAITLAAWWLGGETALMAVALGLPLAYSVTGLFSLRGAANVPRDPLTGLLQRPEFEQHLASTFAATGLSGDRTACFLMDLCDLPGLADRTGQAAADAVVVQTAERLTGALTKGGTLARIADGRFGICLPPPPRWILKPRYSGPGCCMGRWKRPWV